MHIQSNGKNTTTLNQLVACVGQTNRLIRRIANKHQGMKETDLRRLVQAFVLSRIVYSLPYLKLQAAEKNKVECLIRQSYKAALHLPKYTSTERLLMLGIHNTLPELVEAHRIAQYDRLTKTPTGRHILRTLDIRQECIGTDAVQMPRDIHKCLRIDPIPKNMHPEHHAERRKARAKALHRQYSNHKEAVCTDVAELCNHDAFSIGVVGMDLKPISAASVRSKKAHEAEEAAIALAL